MGLKSTLIRMISWKSHRYFQWAVRNPEQAYEKTWREIWGEVGDSPYWRKNKPAASRGRDHRVDDFPISDYETYRSALEKSFRGRISELSGKEILFWCESSGTTGLRKIFPLTPLYMRQLQRSTQPFSYLICGRFPDFLKKPILYFAATEPTEKSPSGIDVGFVSHYMYKKLPPMLQKNYAFPKELYRSGAVFYEWGPLYAMAQDMSGLFAITPQMIVQILQRMVSEFDRYFEILSGKVPWPEGLPPIEVGPERLRTIRRAFEKNPVQLKDLWPSLQVVTCWKGSTCGWQLPALELHNQEGVVITDGQYAATEGWMTVPFVDGTIGGILHPGAHLVEFFEAGSEPRVESIKKPWQLRQGGEYEVLLTTALGFIRYRLYDVVLCKGFVGRTPILEFLCKAGHMISLGQSRFSELHLLEAMRRAGFQPAGKWVFAPAASGDQVVLHTDSDQSGQEALFREFERILGELNPEIESDYQTGILKKMRIEVSPGHSFWSQTVKAQTKQKILLKSPFPASESIQ